MIVRVHHAEQSRSSMDNLISIGADNMNIKNELIEMIKNEIGWTDEGQEFTDDTTLVKDLGLDSVMLVQLIVLIEEKYDVEFEDSHALFDGLNTIGSLAQWILEQREGK